MKYIDITALNKADTEISEDIQKFGDFMAVGEEPTEDNQTCTAFYLLPHQEKIYKIRGHFDKEYSKMSEVFDDILRDALSENDVEGMIDGDPDFIKVLHLVSAQLALNDINISHDSSKMRFLMVSGEVFSADKRAIDWSVNFREIDMLISNVGHIKNIIYMLATWTGSEMEKNRSDVEKFINDFHEKQNLHPKYDYLEGCDERLALTIKLIDMMTFFTEMITTTVDQQALMILQAMQQQMHGTIQPVNADDAVPMDPADVEQLTDDENPIEVGD